MQFFTYDHLPGRLRPISEPICVLAHQYAQALPDSPELTAALRKMLEAKDCLVRAALDADLVDYRDR
jgi:hypothetical protein